MKILIVRRVHFTISPNLLIFFLTLEKLLRNNASKELVKEILTFNRAKFNQTFGPLFYPIHVLQKAG